MSRYVAALILTGRQPSDDTCDPLPPIGVAQLFAGLGY